MGLVYTCTNGKMKVFSWSRHLSATQLRCVTHFN